MDAPPKVSQPQASSLKPQVSLASLTTLPGAIALEARCPYQPETELLLDQSGTLHLLGRHQCDEGDFEQAMTQLLSVRQWVDEHRPLLALTQRQLKLNDDAETVLHLFTDQPQHVTHIVARLGDQVKLHLLQEVAIGNESTWFTTPLS